MAFPPGLLLNRNTGQVTGTPSQAGEFDFTLRVTDAIGVTRDVPIEDFVVNDYTLMALSGTLAIAAINSVYSSHYTLTGGIATYTYSISAGALPTGLTINSATGVVSGTPTVAGTYNFTVKVVDGAAAEVTKAGTIVVPVALQIAGSAIDGSVGFAYTRTFTASGGTAPYTYSIASGSIPAGLSLSGSTGVLSGTPTTAAAYSFVVRVTDAYGTTSNTAAQNITMYAGPALTGTLPRATKGTAYSESLSLVGGVATFTYAVASGSLPTGLSLNTSTGVVSGTPTVAGTYAFTLRVTDGNGQTGSSAGQSITVAATLALSGSLNATCLVGVAYSSNLSVAGGWAPLAWDVSVGSLPAGLTLNASTGVVSGNATTPGTEAFTLRATDADGNEASSAQSLTVTGSLAFVPAYNLSGTRTAAYSSGTSATGGTAPYTYTRFSGTLPTGLSLSSSTGVISGTPTAAGTFTFVVRVTDNMGNSIDSVSTSIVISAAPVFASSYPTKGTLTVAYAGSMSMTGGKTPITFAVQAGALPTSLSLNASTGAVTGTPTVAGAISYTIRATDANGATVDQVVTGTVAQFPTYTGTFLHGTDNTSYSQTLSAALGHTPYTYSKTGSLPTGLSLGSGSGTLSGTPTTPGTYNFTPILTDAAGNIVNGPAQSIVIAAAVSFGAVTLDPVVQGAAFSQTITATGGWTPYTYAISVGSLPTGLSLNASTGAITGTPSGSGSYSFTLRATDNDGNTGTKAFSGTIVVAVTVAVSDHTIASDANGSGDGEASYSVDAGGAVGYFYNDSGADVTGNYPGEGVTAGSSSDVQFRVTKTSGTSGVSGTLNTWRNMSPSGDTYTLLAPSTRRIVTLLVEFRRASDFAALDSCTITLDAQG